MYLYAIVQAYVYKRNKMIVIGNEIILFRDYIPTKSFLPVFRLKVAQIPVKCNFIGIFEKMNIGEKTYTHTYIHDCNLRKGMG